ncbi:MAG: TonB-dependent receptor plug domain-containing protein [Fibrobacterota bacterium]|nr:MAG: TonB-dependent receptor plug domain-containing protein [Fibrobacterota bacterium]
MKPIRTKAAMTLTVAMLLGAPGLQATAPAPAAPAAAGDDMSLADLLNIKLQTGSFLELDLAKSPLSMTIIDRNKIEMAGSRDLSELLEVYVPGFVYMYNRWNGKIWGMRGVTNDRNTKFIVLVNGHKMNTEARDGFFQETAMGLFGDVERIEVLRGPAGLVYGSGAIAGIVNIVTRRTEKSGSEVYAKAGTWGDFSKNYTSAQGTVSGKIADDQSFSASLGWEQSTGLGDGVTQIYGRPLWPVPFWLSPDVQPASQPSDGSALKTPGNWKGTFDYEYKGLRLYGRFTHQVQTAGGFFPRDPWPNYSGSPASLKTNAKVFQDSINAIQNRVNSGIATDNDLVNIADYKARLYIIQLQTQSVQPVQIDGRTVQLDDPYWSSVEASGNHRRTYVADNILLDAGYDLSLGENTLKLKVGFDGNSNILVREPRLAEENQMVNEREQSLEEAFGERRYTLGATYLMKNIPKLQLAIGAEQRFDDIGNDLFGRNSQQQKATHKIVSDILYSNTAIFTEAWYDVLDNFGVDFGIRWDGHTRTIDDGGTLNGKLAGVYTPVTGHTVKLIFQSSSNNGTADNYEYNRNHFDDNGVAWSKSHFYTPTNSAPASNADIVPGVSLEELNSIKPEKVYSFELTSNHDFGLGITASPSVSYNMVRDLFVWSQRLYRVVNVGEYDNMNMDLQVDWKSKYVDLGANHAVQMVVNTEVADQGEKIIADGYTRTGNTWYTLGSDGYYYPKSDKKDTLLVNLVREQVTVDGENFLSIPTHTSKLYADAKLTPWLTFHNDVRIFWGLTGRDSMATVDEKDGFEDFDIHADPMMKWNSSLHMKLPGDWTVGLYVNDILGEEKGGQTIHTLRWNQSYEAGARDLFAVDLRNYAIDVKKSF